MDISVILEQLLRLFLVLCIGMLLAKLDIIDQHTKQKLTKLMLYVTTPLMILDAFNDRLQMILHDETGALVVAVICFASGDQYHTHCIDQHMKHAVEDCGIKQAFCAAYGKGNGESHKANIAEYRHKGVEVARILWKPKQCSHQNTQKNHYQIKSDRYRKQITDM